jgi:hypothetical protein
MVMGSNTTPFGNGNNTVKRRVHFCFRALHFDDQKSFRVERIPGLEKSLA